MTVETLNTESGPFAAGGLVYYFTFQALAADDVKTYVDDVLGAPVVTLNADQIASPGGHVTFASAAAGEVVIRREIVLDQRTEYVVGSAFPAATHEAALDRVVMQVQDEAAARVAGDAASAALVAAEEDRALAAESALAASIVSQVAAEAASRAAADAAIIASGAEPANVGLAPVIATGTLQAVTVNDREAREVWIEDFGEAGAGDWTAILQAALNFLHANNGGTLRLRARTYRIDGQINMPYTASYDPNFGTMGYQRTMRIIGSGGERNSYMAGFEKSGTQLDMRYDSSGVMTGRFLATGNGSLVLQDFAFTDNGGASNTTPFFYDTCATAQIFRVGFIGARGAAPYPDAIVLGGQGDTANPASPHSENSPQMWFGGYGTVIRDCFFDWVGRCLYGRIYSNNIVFDGNTVWLGQDSTMPVIEFDNTALVPPAGHAVPNSLVGSCFTNNLIELGSRPYFAKLKGTAGCVFTGNSFYDPAAPWTTALYHVEGGSTNNYIVTNSMGGIPILDGDAADVAVTNLIVLDTQLTSYHPGPQVFRREVTNLISGGATSSAQLWTVKDEATGRFMMFRYNPTNHTLEWQESPDGVAVESPLALSRSGGAGYWQVVVGGTVRSRVLSAGGYLQVLAPTGSSVDVGTEAHPTDRFRANDTGIGFFGQGPVARPSVTGSKGGNAALASLLTALNALGIISDSTS